MHRPFSAPKRDADNSIMETTTEEQAAWYRLNVDKNPMHIDPTVSQRGGFETPLLHGLCTFGISGRHIYQHYGPFRKIRARFSGTVLPGQTLRTEMWKESDNNVVIWQTRVMESRKLCIHRAMVQLMIEERNSMHKL